MRLTPSYRTEDCAMDDIDPQARRILAERARLLAREAAGDGQARGEPMVVFALGEGSYSLPARSVREVVPLHSLTPLPGVPAWIAGLINVRGQILTAIDIRPLLELPVGRAPAQPLVIVAQDGGAELALLADSVTVTEREGAALMPSLAAERPAAWVRGLDEAISMALDPGLLFADPRLVVDDADD
ncbi:MAG TPA: chemotaxis protein CheW [Herpetosiphonaceae bacterium]